MYTYALAMQYPIYAQHVYKLVHFLYTGATAWPLLIHWSYYFDTSCTQELLLGHFLYTGATAWTLLAKA